MTIQIKITSDLLAFHLHFQDPTMEKKKRLTYSSKKILTASQERDQGLYINFLSRFLFDFLNEAVHKQHACMLHNKTLRDCVSTEDAEAVNPHPDLEQLTFSFGQTVTKTTQQHSIIY